MLRKADCMKCFLQLVAALVTAISFAMVPGAHAAETKPQRPNVVVVFIDDMGWADLSCFGNQDAKTPNIDRLAGEGIRFQQFYANAPICSPSRVAISTGQYPARWRITSFLNNRKSNEERGIAQWLDPKAPMLARILHDAGYATGHFGKWHLGGQRDVGEAPMIREYGFDESLTNFEGLGPRVLPKLDSYDGTPAKHYSLGSDSLAQGPIKWESRDKVTASFANRAVEFIDKSQTNGKPFYINLWPDDVHSPYFPPKDRRDDTSKRGLYLSVLETMDEQLAPLFDRIYNDEKLRSNTIILVCSDNGPEEGAGSAGPFRGTKGLLYEGGVRSPLVVWAPGLMNQEKAGTANTESVFSAIDLVPSLLEIAKATPPSDIKFDGEQLADVLLGNSTESRHAPLLFRRPPDRPSHAIEGNLPDLAIRSGKWKLLCEYDGSKPELYNLETDPGETRNVSKRYPKVANRLTNKVVKWHESLPADSGAKFVASGKGGKRGRALRAAN